jgi:hypothetical protein
MGPAPVIPDTVSADIITKDCRTIYKNYTHVVARCELVQGQFTNMEMERQRSKAPTWMVDHLKTTRHKCDTCADVPRWTTEDGINDLPNGPEISYGIPFRWSAARLLATDIRRILCDTVANTTAACTALLNVDAWKLEDFIGNFMSTPENLFQTNINPSGSILNKTLKGDKPDDSLLWNGPDAGWVACNQVIC